MIELIVIIVVAVISWVIGRRGRLTRHETPPDVIDYTEPEDRLETPDPPPRDADTATQLDWLTERASEDVPE